jgi:hypothetical protein
MIRLIIDLLNTIDSKEINEDIDIAKGKYKFPETIKEFKEHIKNK